MTWLEMTCVASASPRLESGLLPEHRSQGGSKVALCRQELLVQRWSSGRKRAREERRLSDSARDDARGDGVAEAWAGSAAGTLLTRRLEGGSLLTGAAHRKVIFGSLDGEKRASAGDSERDTVRSSVTLRSGTGLQPWDIPHKGRFGGGGSLV